MAIWCHTYAWLRMVMIVDGECVWGCGTVCGGCGWKDVGW